MDKALAYGARDSRFDPWQDRGWDYLLTSFVDGNISNAVEDICPAISLFFFTQDCCDWMTNTMKVIVANVH